MPSKQNIPLIGLALFVAGGVGAFLLLRPSDEDRLHGAALEHAATLGTVRKLDMIGTVAEIALEPDGRRVYADFTRKDGTWTCARNPVEELQRTLKNPDVERQVLERLGRRILERFRMENVHLKEGLRYESAVGRDASGLRGDVIVHFAYPEARGQYVECFRYQNGTWTSEGPGALFDAAGKP